ncbi:uncharacterized protein LOC135082360 [Ostrinia nubilalis]|uniref:uncharacterized protein LOC135082360 n=1 Tax=Ostrinia nubilalis TaxID=29057 RepID=UPI0030824787
MTVKKARSGGLAAVVSRQWLHANKQLDILGLPKPPALLYNVTVGFNEKDQLQLLTKEEDDKTKDYDKTKQENINIDDIANCVNIENYPNFDNTLVFYITKNLSKEAIVLKFENEQDFKRIYFTYKYFKMRNRLTKNSNNYASSDNLFSKKKTYELFSRNRKNSMDDYSIYDKGRAEFDLMQTTDNDGVTHISVQQKGLNRFDQPMSLIGIRTDAGDIGEIDSIIYTDIDIPAKPERKRLFHKKSKAPQPPLSKDSQSKVLKGEFVRVNVDRAPDVVPRDNKQNKVPDILLFRDGKTKRNSPPSTLWSTSNKVTAGYESDREEWKSSRSQFSTTAFDSLARPTKTAMALTLKKPQRLDPVPQYYRLPSDPKPKLTPLPFRPNNFLQRPPRLPRPNPEIKRNFLNTDHRKFTSLQSLELPKKLSEPKKQNDVKKTNYSNISNRITGLTNKLRDLGNPSNTIGRFKAQSHGDVANLKPVLKTNAQDGAKRSVVRTCSAEPPKKVTFSAFATVQVV